MKILISDQGKIPAFQYGGTERVIWYLGLELSKMGHDVTFLVKEGSTCPFAKVICLKQNLRIQEQIPVDMDIVHLNYPVEGHFQQPVIFTNHGNRGTFEPFHKNTVFVSSNHAERYGSKQFVHNGLDWNDYGKPLLNTVKKHFHFLGNAAWRVKNVQGAIDVVTQIPNEKLAVLGGYRFNFKMGLRFTFNPRIEFYGMVGGPQKLKLINQSKGFVFPVRWNEPFGLALIESMYLGCPVFGTPYGSLPELVAPEVGKLSAYASELTAAVINYQSFSRKVCHEYAADNFNAFNMAKAYLKLYEKVVNGEYLNPIEPVLQQETPKYLPWN